MPLKAISRGTRPPSRESEVTVSNEQTLEGVILERKLADEEGNPNVGRTDITVLKCGPRAYKVAYYRVIVNRHTGEIQNHALTIRTLNALKAGFSWDEQHTITLTDEKKDEIADLIDFLASVRSSQVPDVDGRYLVVPISRPDGYKLESLLNVLKSADQVGLLAKVLEVATRDPSSLQALASAATANPEGSGQAVAALNVGRYRNALRKLRTLIEDDALEGAYQIHLKANPWMFGSEYSEPLERRRHTRDEILDFMVRRTVDGYLEVIEIKTALGGERLFRHDKSHNSFYPGVELSKVLGQVMRYLARLDADKYVIGYEDNEKVEKSRAKIVIGRDVDEEQVDALRRFNGHLHRIEVLTFDQLTKVADRMIEYAEQAMESSTAVAVGPDGDAADPATSETIDLPDFDFGEL